MTSNATKGGVIGEINRKLAESKKKGDADVAVTALAEEPPVSVQGELPTMETERDEEIIRAAEAYVQARDERMKLTKIEVEWREFLQALMNSKGLKHYKYERVEVDIVVAEEKVKVKVAKQEEDEEE